MAEFRCCAIVPVYDNPATIVTVVRDLRQLLPVLVIDDGSCVPVAGLLADAGELTGVNVHRRSENGGKGAAVKDGLRLARDLGHTHALQIDADGQHDLTDVPRFIAAARAAPEELILGQPLFDDSAPRLRRWARQLTTFWVNFETLGNVIADPMCGFRVYPLAIANALSVRGSRMDFDPEIAVRFVWGGARVQNIATRVRYLSAAQGGVSHYRLLRDTLLISFMHVRLVCTLLLLLLSGRYRKGQ